MINQRVSITTNFISWLGSILLLMLFSYLAWRGYRQNPEDDVLERWVLAFLASELLLLILLSEVKRLIRRLLQEVKQSESLKQQLAAQQTQKY
jgi:hypothetical protein